MKAIKSWHLDNLGPNDEVRQVYKVYFSRTHKKIVAKVQLKRANNRIGNLGRPRHFGDVLAKVPISQLKEERSAIFVDFLSDLINQEIKR